MAQNALGNASKVGQHLKKWMRSQKKSQKLGVTRLKIRATPSNKRNSICSALP